MSADTPVLVIDDGELESVCDLLDQLGADFERIAGSNAHAPVRHPETLLITTEMRARSLRIERSLRQSAPRATWIAFVSAKSAAQGSSLQASGFDFLIRTPVHEVAVRVLVQRALFRGSETRRAPRIVCGHPVTFKTGFWRQKALLIDLSLRGCRLALPKRVKEKCEISVELPKTLAGGRALDLIGHVVRVASEGDECGGEGETVVGVRFAPIEGETRRRLQDVLAGHVLGPAVLPPNYVSKAARQTRAPERPADVPSSEASQRPTRANRRAIYSKKVTAMDGPAAYMVMCRDLSTGGMRIEPVEGLHVGSRLHLAIQLSSRDEPFLVEASVTRDDGERGLALEFEWIDPEPQQRLQELLERLPEIEALQDDSRGQGTILAQRLPDPP